MYSLYYLGSIAFSRGNYDLAITQFRAGIATGKDAGIMRYLLRQGIASSLEAKGDFAAAAAAYRDAGAVAEANMKTQSRLGEARVLGLAGKKTEAAALYRLILKETPETPLRDLVEIQLAQIGVTPAGGIARMKLRVCFLWHMHQPYYKDPETGSYILPWVRLHAIKDYAALPVIFRGHPGVRHTVNLVPSLLVQVRDYVENGAEDVFLSVSRKNALDLTKEENEFLLRNFFSAYAPTMILPQPRYAELFRGHEAALRSLGRKNGGPGGYGASEYTDLATLFNLTWFHPLFREEDPELSRLWSKGSGYTEREKHYVLDHQIEVMGRVIEEYRKLSREDGGELSSSPMYHPILPLLIDNRSALDALPGAALPGLPFSWPGDARIQLERGREVFRDLFGADPAGLWPSEGSISPATLEMAGETGFRWAATDEILLARAFGKPVQRDPDGIPLEPDWFYRPYAAVTKSGIDPGILPGPPPVRPDRLRIFPLGRARCRKQFHP